MQVAIMATSACSNSKSNINVHLTGRQKDSSNFSSSKSLITLFVKILRRQTFAPYGIVITYVCIHDLHGDP